MHLVSASQQRCLHKPPNFFDVNWIKRIFFGIYILTDNRFVINWLAGKSCVPNPLDIVIHAVWAEAPVTNVNITSLAKIFRVLVNHPTVVVFGDYFRRRRSDIRRVNSANSHFNSSRDFWQSLTWSRDWIGQRLSPLGDYFIDLCFVYFSKFHIFSPDIGLEPEKWQIFSPEKTLIDVKTRIKYLVSADKDRSLRVLT